MLFYNRLKKKDFFFNFSSDGFDRKINILRKNVNNLVG